MIFGRARPNIMSELRPQLPNKGNKHLLLAKRWHKRERLQKISQNAYDIVRSAKLDKNCNSILCAVLFWCEGGKDTRSGVRFMNSDPVLVRTILFLLRGSFLIGESRLRALIHLHEYHDTDKQINFWSKITNIPARQFHKSYIKKSTGTNTKPNYPGCISIRYNDSSLGKLLEMIYIEFAETYRGIV